VNLIIFGPPGAGKGTQSEKLASDFNLFKVSTGDLLREEIAKKSTLGIKIKEVVDKGSLVSDLIINDLIENLLSQRKYFNRLVFDGYPRTFNQTISLEDSLKKFKQKILCVLSLNVDKEVLIKRIIGRINCSKCGLTFNEFFYPADNKNHHCGSGFLVKRSDDQKSTIEARYETYLKETMPIISFYKEKNLLHEINGMDEITHIYEQIYGIISTLKG